MIEHFGQRIDARVGVIIQVAETDQGIAAVVPDMAWPGLKGDDRAHAAEHPGWVDDLAELFRRFDAVLQRHHQRVFADHRQHRARRGRNLPCLDAA